MSKNAKVSIFVGVLTFILSVGIFYIVMGFNGVGYGSFVGLMMALLFGAGSTVLGRPL